MKQEIINRHSKIILNWNYEKKNGSCRERDKWMKYPITFLVICGSTSQSNGICFFFFVFLQKKNKNVFTKEITECNLILFMPIQAINWLVGFQIIYEMASRVYF